MTGTTIERLPADSNISRWTAPQRAIMAQLGLVDRNDWRGKQPDAPAGVIESFLLQCDRTKLDPTARQIYCIERGGKWGVQISIDGFRLIAERSKGYRGQTPVQWTSDGREWLDVWLAETPPAAARVGVLREGFAEPMYAVATYAGYCPRDGKTGALKPKNQWETNSANQLAKCAEMLALRKAFPNDLSGLYGTEEMEQASPSAGSGSPRTSQTTGSQAVAALVEPEKPKVADESWSTRAADCADVDAVRALYKEARTAEVLGLPLASGETVDAMLQARAKALTEQPKEDVVDAEVVDEGPFLKAIPLAESADDLAKIQEQAERVGAWTDEVQKAATQRAASLSWAPEEPA